MSLVASARPRKRATNLSVDVELLSDAKALGVNLSQTLEAALRDAVAAKRREQWLVENRAGIDAYNELVDRIGAFGDEWRTF